jgi:hypothetical protein
MRFVPRPRLKARIEGALGHAPVTLLLGPRQCGKTTLARRISAARKATFFDLEDPQTPLRPERAFLVLQELSGLVVIDEFQRQPALFETLRVLADRRPLRARFLILGSASPDLVRGISESLAGRVAYVEMGGLSLDEIGVRRADELWLRGGFPNSLLAPTAAESYRWRLDFIRSLLERDIPQLGIRVPATALRRFWTMIAHVHGQNWNAADLARSMAVKEDTVRRYLDILTGAFMIRQLPPWFENVGKRLVKAPKIYFRDTGILHALLGLRTRHEILSHPKLGLSWEGFALEQIIEATAAERDVYFYKTHGGAELDMLLARGGKRFGFECKHADAPEATRSMHVALKDLGLHRLWVVYPGASRYPLTERIEAVPLAEIPDLIEQYKLVW